MKMSHEELLNAYINDPGNEELKQEIIDRMEKNENGYDSEGEAQEDLIAEDIKTYVIVNGTTDEVPVELDEDIDLQATLLHEHGMQTQMSLCFNEKVLQQMEVGDKLIIVGTFVSDADGSKLGDFEVEIEKTKTSYGISIDSDDFYYELC